MESDSDSDGSHISGTPPRNQTPPSPPPPPPPPPAPSTTAKPVRKTKSKPSSNGKQKPALKPSKYPQNPPKNPDIYNPSSDSSFLSPDSTLLPPFSLPIRRLSSLNPSTSASDTIRAGSFSSSKSSSFLKFQKTALNFEDDPISPSGSPPKSEIEVNGEGGDSDNLRKRAVRKPSNLIGGGSESSLLPAKKPKCSGEGNFVKLNINGHGRRFTFKGRSRNFSTSSRRNFRRGKGRLKGAKGVESNDLVDEEGLVLESSGNQSNGEIKKSKIDSDLLKNAVLDVRNGASDENLMKLLKITHGYDSFRDGQLEAIKMVLAGKSTMLVLPTGAGKSLCYQLPAIVFTGTTIVVSPLMALMIDQLKQLPPIVNGAFLSSSQSAEEMSETLTLLQEGRIKVLFVSPERFLNAQFISIISSSSPISLIVIDEAHCASEWSHNFRPSYMRLRASVLREKLNAQCILAMTATATRKTLHAIMCALDIPSDNLVQTVPLRENLQLAVSSSGNNKMKDLVTLIKSSPYSEIKSMIIYCKFQSETDIISKHLRDSGIPAMSYHSGMLAKDRSRVQALFCSNKIRVVVATVAFGMGLDKRDVGAVIHYSMPGSMEEYVQEIGRAGRDGRLSHCHLLLDDTTYFKLRSLACSDGVDEYALSKLLCQVFSNEMGITGEIRSLIKESTSRKFDIKEEVILTILTQLELGEVQYLHLLPQMNVTCSLNFHKTPPVELGARDSVVAGILKQSENKHGLHVFDIPTVANTIGLTAMDLLDQLQNLKSMGEITYELKDLAYCYVIVENPEDLCSLAARTTKWLYEVEFSKVWKLDMMFNAAAFALKSCERMSGCDGAQHTQCLQRRISDYFSEENRADPPNKMIQNRLLYNFFGKSNTGAKFTPRAVARIMHGIASPAYPSANWSKTHFWGRYAHVDFNAVMEAAKAELMNFAGKDAP
ncbi:hypothetical protein Cgig2_027097 [Carnegiea gigantea]|uniref:DNA 3'-5' helicase n=1 Tax=Carnegiea gigantea TaxID=171969 RepID=A0A9Q1QF30_9CARY|nr:hypothetical protein Cgig2_027097 [Carnegiea gigantea]